MDFNKVLSEIVEGFGFPPGDQFRIWCARSDLMVCTEGAHMTSPGLLAETLAASGLHEWLMERCGRSGEPSVAPNCSLRSLVDNFAAQLDPD